MVEDSPEVLALFEAHLHLVDVVARQLTKQIGPVLDLEDLVSYGQEGLLLAARRFDPSQGTPFRRYANYRIRGAMVDGMRSASRLPRRAHEKLRAIRAANTVAEGFASDTGALLQSGADAASLDDRLQQQLAAMATAMAIGIEGEFAMEESELVRVSSDPTPEKLVEGAQLTQLLNECIDALPEREAVLIRRHFLQEQKLDEIIDELGISRSWASRVLNRGLSRIAQMLRQQGVT